MFTCVAGAALSLHSFCGDGPGGVCSPAPSFLLLHPRSSYLTHLTHAVTPHNNPSQALLASQTRGSRSGGGHKKRRTACGEKSERKPSALILVWESCLGLILEGGALIRAYHGTEASGRSIFRLEDLPYPSTCLLLSCLFPVHSPPLHFIFTDKEER